MTITLNDEESREYLAMKDGKIMYTNIQQFIEVLDEIGYMLTPIPERHYRDNKTHREEITWENADRIIRKNVRCLQEKLESIVTKHRKEQNNG